ncbi:MAG: hypothetical protein K5910_02095 [Bacteroidales bacterium]|nr:hypothetical protein [Bacteroidales bacterium]
MRGRGIWALAVSLLLGWVLSACSEPDGAELFLHRDAARDGVYVFSLPLTDTTAAYDFWFYSRVERQPLTNLQLNVQWLSPSGDGFSETVYMQRVDPRGSREAYRSGMVPAEAGAWQLSVRPVGVDGDFLGLGVIYKKQDGTR